MTSLARTDRRGQIAKYDPDKGLKAVAVADAAIQHFARAKDATKLQAAIRGKLEAQADFVTWWDTQADRIQEHGVLGHWGKQSRVDLPADLKKQYTVTDPKGRFTLDIQRLS